VLYLAAFDAMLDANARGDQQAAKGARALMEQLHSELVTAPPTPAPRARGPRHQEQVRELLAFLESRSETNE
jgi:hypothetical protein